MNMTAHPTAAAGYVGLVYLSVYLIGTRNFPAEQVYWVSAVAISVEVVTLPYFGILAGRVGRRKVLLGATAAFLVLAYPFFMAFSATDSIVVVALIYCALMLVDSAQKAPLITEYTLMFPMIRLTPKAIPIAAVDTAGIPHIGAYLGRR
jgi:MHS family proline/betaine transporter-like MFS transporter